MAVSEGKFQLYTSITPPLEAGDWRLVASQKLNAQTALGTLSSDQLKIDKANINFRVRSPRYLMPPDQVLSTYPPANSFGSYGSRLPQVVIKRRTLPWERHLDDSPANTPWLALVLIAEGEARLDTGVDVADCVTTGTTLNGVVDVQKGNRLVVRKSVINKIFPTQKDVALLAHAREVDINDTELMMGDDDGFLAVVISNRLPLPAKDKNGDAAPVKYLACLINLEGQYASLLEKSPDPVPAFVTEHLALKVAHIANATTDDHIVMGTAASPDRVNAAGLEIDTDALGPAPRAQAKAAGSSAYRTVSGVAATSGASSGSTRSQWSTSSAQLSSTEVALQMAHDFRAVQAIAGVVIDPEFRFPVLMHWSFTTTGSTTFRSLMEGLDSGLLGDVGEQPSDLSGRLPLEVVESGHVGLGHKTRAGDDVRAWYRGPLMPHPSAATSTERLPLAHSSDQLRIIIQDGREDLSLASAFEIGRLLSLSQPSIIAALMRWRQRQYHTARTAALVEVNRSFWEDILGTDFVLDDFYRFGPAAGRFLVNAIVTNPETMLGAPRPRVTAGRPLEVEGLPSDVLSMGLGMNKNVLKGDIGTILENVRAVDKSSIDLILDDLGKVAIREGLEGALDRQRIDLVSNSLANILLADPITGPAFPVIDRTTDVLVNDSLDVILAATAPDDEDDS